MELKQRHVLTPEVFVVNRIDTAVDFVDRLNTSKYAK